MDASEVVEAWLKAWNAGDLDAIMALYRPDASYAHPMLPEPISGANAIREVLAGFLGAFSSFRLQAECVVVCGNQVAAEVRHAATHTGPLPLPSGAAAPTGKGVDVTAAHFFTLADDGRIASEHQYTNPLQLLGQLGLAPL